jgi:hypothetical protein
MEQVSARRIASVDMDFVGTSLIGSDLQASRFIRGDFTRADLTGANIAGCIFDECRFCDSRWTGARGLESVKVDSKIVVGPVDLPVELVGDAALDWIRRQGSQ